jgi:hypothetical protein
MNASIFITLSAAILLLLGLAHLFYTFHGNKFDPRDAQLKARLMEVSPVISSQTSLWRAGIGFHASHSFGAMLFGLVYGYLSLMHSAFLFQSWFLLGLGLLTLTGYTVLGKLYWFSVPFRGVSLATILYSVGLAAHFS